MKKIPLLLCFLFLLTACAPSQSASQTSSFAGASSESQPTSTSESTTGLSGIFVNQRVTDPGTLMDAVVLTEECEFTMYLNLLAGLGNITGRYEVFDGYIVATDLTYSFEGFAGDGQTTLRFTVLDENQLVFSDENNDMPLTLAGDVFVRSETADIVTAFASTD